MSLRQAAICREPSRGRQGRMGESEGREKRAALQGPPESWELTLKIATT